MNNNIRLKRLIDIILATILIIVLSPILVIVGIIIRFSLGSPVVFTQRRIGINNRVFKIYKFRTMKEMRNSKGEELPDKDRLTPLGKILRALSIDELPEIFNILKGEMSFIGPRPLLEEYLPLYSERQLVRHSVLPGLSGWAQINGRNQLSWNEKFELDIWYVENWSLLLDMKIFIKTFSKVLKREGINQSQLISSEKFNGAN